MSLFKERFKGLNNNQLKIIAMISMLVDHAGLLFFPEVKLFRCIGRLAFPIYAYMIAEGCRYTKNRKKYLSMIALMAIVFQIVFFVMSSPEMRFYQGILVNFSLSISVIFAIDLFIKNKKLLNAILMLVTVGAVLFIHLGLTKILGEYGFAIDYGIWGLLLPVLVYLIPSKVLRAIGIAALLIVMTLVSGKDMQWWSLLCVPLFLMYNGQRGSKKLKYLFYIFYPLHLVILYGIALLTVLLSAV